MGKFINFEFLIPITRNLTNIKLRNIMTDWLIPIIIAVLLVYYFPLPEESAIRLETLKSFLDICMNAVAIIIGFTMAIEAIQVSSSSKNFDLIKNIESDDIVNNKPISIFQEMINSITFLVILEFFVLLINLISIIICNANVNIDVNLIYGLNIFLIFLLISQNIRNITNTYLIFWKKESDYNKENKYVKEISSQESLISNKYSYKIEYRTCYPNFVLKIPDNKINKLE